MSRWNEETTVKFVQEYREKRCLWDTRAAVYKNKQAREAAYKEIQDIMGIEGFGIPEIKNKIRALRSTYSQEKKKIRYSMKSGAGSDETYVSTLKWFPEMDGFLRSLENNKRPTQDNLKIVQSEEVVEEGQQGENQQEILLPTHENPVEAPPSLPKKTRPMSKLKQVTSVVKELRKISDTVTREPANENQYIVFGRSVGAQLMALTPISAIRAQDRIQSILTSFKLEDLQGSTNNINTPTPSFDVSTPMQSHTYSYVNSGSHSSGSVMSPYDYAESADNDVSQANIITQAFSNI